MPPPVTAPPVVPAAVRPPADTDVEHRIHQLVEFVVKNGPSFEAMTRQKNEGALELDCPLLLPPRCLHTHPTLHTPGNADFAFLYDGPGAAYYKWRLFTRRNGVSDDVAKSEVEAAELKHLGFLNAPLLGPDTDRLARTLSSLDDSRDRISAAAAQLAELWNSAGDAVQQLVTHLHSCGTFPERLRVLYVINDVLFASYSKDQARCPFCAALLQPLLTLAMCVVG